MAPDAQLGRYISTTGRGRGPQCEHHPHAQHRRHPYRLPDSRHLIRLRLRLRLARSQRGRDGQRLCRRRALDGDASSLFYNPAALAGVKDWDASANLTGLVLGSSAQFSATTAAGTPAGGLGQPRGFIGDALVPAAAVRYRLTDDLAVGVSFSVPWGEVTDYPDGWAGRYYALSTSLTAYNATAAVAYQLTDALTVAAGAQVQYVRSHLTQAIDFGSLGAANHIPGAVPGTQDGVADLHGHSWGGGYVLGALWRPAPEFSFGLSYRSRVEQVLKGSERFTFDNAGIAATIHALTGAFADSTGRADLPTPAGGDGKRGVGDRSAMDAAGERRIHQLERAASALRPARRSGQSAVPHRIELEGHLVRRAGRRLSRRRTLDAARRNRVRRSGGAAADARAADSGRRPLLDLGRFRLSLERAGRREFRRQPPVHAAQLHRPDDRAARQRGARQPARQQRIRRDVDLGPACVSLTREDLVLAAVSRSWFPPPVALPVEIAVILCCCGALSRGWAQGWDDEKASLVRDGITPAIVYDGDFAATVGGGARRGTAYAGELHLQAAFDGDRLLDWPGAMLFVRRPRDAWRPAQRPRGRRAGRQRHRGAAQRDPVRGLGPV
ncbi:MAG: outer membrane protein transport protein [Rhizomicrobium sp.]